nr:BTAD domain-containing putative transcriptional regulator [Salsipaludibacter albus]
MAAPPGRSRDVSVLADAIWDDEPPHNAHRLVQALVSRLRAALGQDGDAAGPLASVEGGWRLDLGDDQLDAARFESLVDRSVAELAAGDPQGAGELVDRALELWRGRPFGELGDEPVLVAEAMRLEERRLDALQVRMQVRLAAGAPGPVITELKELLAEHPLHEQLWGLLMVALARAGRRAEALVTYQRVRERLVDELGVEPGPELQQLHTRILRDDDARDAVVGWQLREDVGSSPGAVIRGMPAATTSFVGRRRELADLQRLVGAERVVTVVGPGGVGKTRLASAVAARVAAGYPRGGAFVDLTRVSSERLAAAIASGLGAVGSSRQPVLATLVEHVRRGPTLVVLDNCEHLLPDVAELVAALAAAGPDLVVLATSRERLGVAGERVYALAPLATEVHGAGRDVADRARREPPGLVGDAGGAAVGRSSGPDPAGSSETSDAARLFLDRARAVAPGFRADPPRVEDLCRRVDGLPLSIELAAARAGSLGIDGLVSGLDDRLRLLRSARGSVARHGSLRAVLDWSHDLLEDEEQAAFRRLGVFTGSFDLDAATAVVDLGTRPSSGTGGRWVRGGGTAWVADLVGRLADKSLLVHQDTSHGSRWILLDSVRDYALERLADGDEAATVRRRHLRWAVATALDLRERMGAGADWREAFRRVEGDLRAALASHPSDLPSEPSAGQPADGPAAGEPADRDDADRLDLAFAVAALQSRTGSYHAAQEAYETAIGLARSVGGADALARAALGASVSGMVFGVSDRGRVDWLEEALAAQGEAPTSLRARLLARLAMELYWSADRGRSQELADHALEVARTVGGDAVRAHALFASHYTTRGPQDARQRLALSAEVVERAERGGAMDLALAGRAAHVVDLLSVGDLTGMDAALGLLWEGADRLQRPAFQWYTDVYRLVRALLEGRFADADALAATAIAAGRNVAEFTVGLDFAESITDLRDPDPAGHRRRAERLEDMAVRFPGVLVWRCLALLDQLALVHPGPRSVLDAPLPTARHEGADDVRAAARSLADEVLDRAPRDAHWVVETCLLVELAAELGDAHLAARGEAALRPHAGTLAVAGRVGACRGSVSHALGLASWTLGDLDRAITDLDEAVATHDRLHALPFLARSLAVRARVHEVRDGAGDRAAAERDRATVATLARDLEPHVTASSRS